MQNKNLVKDQSRNVRSLPKPKEIFSNDMCKR